ncbi:ATP-binding cassette domain-containing protein [Actinomadura parmotrematis]|uniref:ATP-binding cassette domain-containing protein n=1 Tax=Actinomadura parmotrematis TaxID=2864039 RepID=A0ABS7FM21_9ACTN|nr:ATP-binding cassette domain-containing protein [Actinomadura parmotrematis]MBW8481427.1 ATP-binding cassette domain-containing protein [Actinomadura parmotrematis]
MSETAVPRPGPQDAGAAEHEHPEPVVDADGLGVRTRRGWIFSGVALRALAGDVVAVAGPGGSGRTSLLLALAGRMRPSAGELRVCGRELPGDEREVRRAAAVARAGGAAVLDPDLTVGDHVRERTLTVKGLRADAFEDVRALVGLSAGDRALVGDIGSAEGTRLALGLALLESPRLIVLDDLDDGAGLAAQRALWETAARVARSSDAAVVASAADAAPAEGSADVLVRLGEGA